MRKKIIVILDICIVLAIICVCVFGKKTFDDYKAEQQQAMITEKQTEIQNFKETFEQETDRTQKLNILKNTQKSYTEYKQSKNINDDCKKMYESTLAFEKKYFVDDYDKVINLNNILNIDGVTDKNKINECSVALTDLKDTIKTEYDMYDVVTEEKYMEYITVIDGLLTSYTEREKVLSENDVPEKENEDEQKEETTKKETESETKQTESTTPTEKKKKNKTPSKSNANSSIVDNVVSGSTSVSDDIIDSSDIIPDDIEDNNDRGNNNDDIGNNEWDNSDENNKDDGEFESIKPE